LNKIIYTDSNTAIAWVKKKKAGTKLELTERNKMAFEWVEKAENWLRQNDITTPIVKWETDKWGEIPADFGRK
jgi:ribonuclease HI